MSSNSRNTINVIVQMLVKVRVTMCIPYKGCTQQLNWQTLEERRKFHRAKLTFLKSWPPPTYMVNFTRTVRLEEQVADTLTIYM